MNFRLIIVLALFATLSCSSEKNEKSFSISKTETFIVDTSKSLVKWDRFVDNKLINKKVKLFGSYVDVKMENVTFNSSGTTPVTGGELIYINDVFSSGKIQMNFSVCRFYSEEEESFFKVKEYPPVIMQIKSIEQDSLNKSGKLNILATLTIRDSIKNISFPADFVKDSLNNLRMSGEYILQTLDWPIRENPDVKNIRKDEITFKFDLGFLLSKTATDTIYDNK